MTDYFTFLNPPKRTKGLDKDPKLQVMWSNEQEANSILQTHGVPFSMSSEQFEIVQCFKLGYSIQIPACVGAANTSSMLILAILFPKVKFLMLTYNKVLADETNADAKTFALIV